MTPATRLLDAHRTEYRLHTYEPSTAHSDYGIDASNQLGVAAARVFKTLVVELDSHELVVAAVPVAARLDMKRLAAAAGAKKAFMADRVRVEKTTGYVLGGVSPLGQKKPLRSFIDVSAGDFPTIYVSGGRRGLEIEIDACLLGDLLEARFCVLAR
ncbi:Cys-tRNA(Pro) deacylase [Salinisphaera sp. T31B1]|uniref:Cys-tRNA(Pro) deacylase n=1 Tax=Salinisphaera sp. T31B1 TaxID=727963 RepID=UPI0033419F01